MRMLLLIAILAGVSWYYFIGGRKISDDQVRAFYQMQTHATLSRNPEALCNLLDNDFESRGISVVYGQRTEVTQNKEETCAAYKQMYQGIADIGARLGGIATLGYEHHIDEVEVSSNRKSAIASVHFALTVAGSVMQYRGHSKDTLIRRAGRVLLLRSEEKSSIGNG
ncbi:hypothetical protein [Methylocaldum sp. RMAD-M]|uniref:hypothetical protein n=1 Tax=Methylocaldum sp. RMAD-M TaxID=2806557 RepID=UPI000A32770B|nr:hypothetical protein [Methylocaldum sp. RMAD-M]MBP1151265.1 hypothetical protein [Methylocaldum sp. RMAD-M]